MNDNLRIKLPANVQAQVKRAKDIQDAMQNPEALNQMGLETPTPGAQPPAQETPAQATKVQDTPVAPTLQAQPVTPAQPQDTDDYKARYFTLEGKYKAEVPALATEVRSLKEQNQILSQQIEQLNEAATKTKEDSTPEIKLTDLDKEALESYGLPFGDVFDHIQKLTNELESTKTQLSETQAKIAGTENKVENVAKTQQELFVENHAVYMSEVEHAVNDLGVDFKQLNVDPNFLNWLRQHPDGMPHSRLDILQDAERKLDKIVAVNLFKEYLSISQNAAQPVQPQVSQTPMPGTPDQNAQIHNLQPAPINTGSDLTPPGQMPAKTFTREEIKAFYQKKANGGFKNNPEEAAAIEKQIFASLGPPKVA